jgi:ABC-type polysaccharide/polyol phosphate export permease
VTAAWALVRANWLTARTYRLSSVFAFLAVLVPVVPIYLAANAMQPLMAGVIRSEAEQYFAYVLVGTIAYSFVSVSVGSLSASVGGSIGTGTLEALLGTRTGVPTILAGMAGYGLLWTTARALVLLGAGWMLGMTVSWERLPAALLVLGLIVAVHVPFGVMAAAMMLAFRTAGPLPRGVIVASTLLGGVYYPAHVAPSWIERVAVLVPLGYGARALRRVLLEGQPLAAVLPDLAVLALGAAVLLAASGYAFAAALRYARRRGTLGQY